MVQFCTFIRDKHSSWFESLSYSADNLGTAAAFAHHITSAFAHFPPSQTGWLATFKAYELDDGFHTLGENSVVM